MKKMIHIDKPGSDSNYHLCTSVCGVFTKARYDAIKNENVFVPVSCRRMTFSRTIYTTCDDCFNHPSLALLDLAEIL